MGFAVLLALLLIAGAVVARSRWGWTRDRPGPSGQSGPSGLSGMSDLDAEADANRWVVRLGAGLSALEVRAWTGARVDGTATQALTDASERLRTARAELATARTAAEYALVKRTAAEGIDHVRRARTSLGLDQADAEARRSEDGRAWRSAQVS
ncbi:hypothetical protein J8N05_06720 [Streptomyces sp. BH-SS-21]|uniref:Uncharacterized protein n=1 Tax=Streptomyces liliiviolaceus TaxID=2823109 RepID=A0A940XWK6_9ACTN|nr:hypothetical protein [Streptomyces liliiviolaceus]MBQ0847905.1 hypothetical protein [Streptomyces liliiviolaceus]